MTRSRPRRPTDATPQSLWICCIAWHLGATASIEGSFAHSLEQGAGAALVAEEALAADELRDVTDWLEQQPPWSDFPFVVLANGHKGVRSARAFETLDRLRNVVLLERPLHAESMVRAVRSALNARRRQYEARDVLARSREELERLVPDRTREREEALAQLHEAQKLETIGQLTGGVAHDFNNLLTPVMGNLDLFAGASRRTIYGRSAWWRMRCRRRAALRRWCSGCWPLPDGRTFSREPSTCRASLGIEDLVTRSIGPTVAVKVNAPPDLPAAMVDPGQLELAVLNLAINARDAMPEAANSRSTSMPRSFNTPAGTTAARTLHPDPGVGQRHRHGRSDAERAIEPFFSTKGLGKGTGLGLSMVHGLAAQSGGALFLSSTHGVGTQAELWLPTANEEASDQRQAAGGSSTCDATRDRAADRRRGTRACSAPPKC